MKNINWKKSQGLKSTYAMFFSNTKLFVQRKNKEMSTTLRFYWYLFKKKKLHAIFSSAVVVLGLSFA